MKKLATSLVALGALAALLVAVTLTVRPPDGGVGVVIMAAMATAPASASMSARATAITAIRMPIATVLTPITPIGAGGIFIAGITAGTSELAPVSSAHKTCKGPFPRPGMAFCLASPVNVK